MPCLQIKYPQALAHAMFEPLIQTSIVETL
jgi:hypothetical protein